MREVICSGERTEWEGGAERSSIVSNEDERGGGERVRLAWPSLA